MATVSVALAAELARLHGERGVAYVAAPVLGRVNVAEAGQLNILAAGEARALLAVQPLFDAMGRKTWYFGERPEQANAVKLAVNFMIGSAIGAMSEAVALVRGYDVDKAAFLEMATSTAFAAPVYQGYGQAIAEERFEPAGFKAGAGPEGPAPGAGSGRAGARAAATGRRAARCAHREPGARRGQLDWAALSRTPARRAGLE